VSAKCFENFSERIFVLKRLVFAGNSAAIVKKRRLFRAINNPLKNQIDFADTPSLSPVFL
jgi:hypothetical protein